MTFRRSVSRPPSRRIKTWGVGPEARDQAIVANGKTLWGSGTTPSAPLTVIRTRGIAACYLTLSTSALDGFLGAHGIYMMTEDAFAVGVTAAFDPLTDANSDMWLWHSFFDIRAISTTIADGVNAVAAVSKVEIDSKAMRKGFDPERVMVGVTGVLESGTASMELFAQCRQLFLT